MQRATGGTPARPRLVLVVGTRPEAIKVAPVARAALASGLVEPVVVATGQHPTLVDQALAPFQVAVDERIELPPRPTGSQAELLAALLPRLESVLARVGPDAVLVQGDTASALAGALTGFWHQAPVVHLEAGLRSFDLANPFPEEAYRRLIAPITRLHLPPTPRAAVQLRNEGLDPSQILCIGNTVVDAAEFVGASGVGSAAPADGERLVLLTVHRRENWGEPLRDIARAVRDLVEAVDDVRVLVPAHPNVLVREPLQAELGGLDRVDVVEPLDHPDLLAAVARAHLVLTDSGGIQEEAPTFGTPTLVLRQTTERPEAVEQGCAELVGTDRAVVARRAIELLTDEPARQRMVRAGNPFGDGRAGMRAVQAVAWLLGRADRPEPWEPALAPEPETVAAPTT